MEPWNNRRVPAFALAFVERCEGFEAKPYKDGGGVWTIGIGSTADKNGQPVSGNTPPVTHAEARELLERDMGKALRQVRGSVLLPLNDHQAAALIAFAYNLGDPRLAAPTLLKKVNGGDLNGAATAFLMYCNDNGKKVLGLVRRRWAEAAIFLGWEPDHAFDYAWEHITSTGKTPPLPFPGTEGAAVDAGAPAAVVPTTQPVQGAPAADPTADDLNARELARIGGQAHG